MRADPMPTIPDAQTILENDDVHYAARGNLAFLMSVIRSGEQLSPDEEAVVRKTIGRLETAEADHRAALEALHQEVNGLRLGSFDLQKINEDYSKRLDAARQQLDAATQRIARVEAVVASMLTTSPRAISWTAVEAWARQLQAALAETPQ